MNPLLNIIPVEYDDQEISKRKEDEDHYKLDPEIHKTKEPD